jgi:hypothetical protein
VLGQVIDIPAEEARLNLLSQLNDAPSASSAAMGGASQVGQLVQAMASFGAGSGAADGLNVAPLGADTSQQTLLTTPQHA